MGFDWSGPEVISVSNDESDDTPWTAIHHESNTTATGETRLHAMLRLAKALDEQEGSVDELNDAIEDVYGGEVGFFGSAVGD